MSDGSFSLSTPAEVLLALGVSEALAKSESPTCWNYGQVFFARAKSVEADGETDIAKAWRLLAQLCQVAMQEDNPDEPFRPMYQMVDGRSLVPADIDQVSADAVHQLGMAVDDPELKARLLDITWERLRNPEAARQAVESYLDAANRLFDPEHWVDYFKRVERALRLARRLADKVLIDAVLADIEQKVIALDGSDPLFMTSRLMELLHEFKKGDPDRMTEIARKAAGLALDESDFERARAHLENVRRWRRAAKDQDGEREARIAIAQTYEQKAVLNSGEHGALLAAHLLERAHQSYRDIPGMRAKTDEVYGRLRLAQQHAANSMHAVTSGGIDISDMAEAAREHVAGKPFKEAFLAFAMIIRPTEFEKATESARDLMERFPLQGIMGGAKVDRDGRVVAHRTVAIGADEAEAEQALWERVVEHVTMSYQLDVQAAIVPALNQLMFEHSPSLRDMRDLVVHNPFIPPGHEELFAKGFLAGLRWDFPVALSILVPQLENSLRHLLVTAGHEVTRRDKHGLQSVIQMGTILSDRRAQLEPIMSADIVKELKVLFSDQHGPDLRNDIAHGVLDHGGFFSVAAVYAWWFILFLCMNPVYRRFRQESDREVEGQSRDELFDGSGASDDFMRERNQPDAQEREAL